METPKYLVQISLGKDKNGPLYGYWTKKAMLHDIAINKEDGKVKVFKKNPNRAILKYSPIEIHTGPKPVYRTECTLAIPSRHDRAKATTLE